MNERNDIAGFEQTVGRRLLLWGGFSILSGLALWLRPPLWRGIGQQFVVWGIIDAAIALFGRWQANRRQGEQNAVEMTQAANSFRRLLLINTGLDVLYMLGGVILVRTRGVNDERWRGHGIGIIIQGGFLFFFDLIHALRMPRPRADTHDV